MINKAMRSLKPSRLPRPRWWLLAGLAVLAIDVGLAAWGLHRDSRWNATVRGLCKTGYAWPPLPENGWIGWLTLCTIGPAVLIVLIGAVQQSRHSQNAGSIVAILVATAVATLAALWLLLIGLLLIDPRSISTGTDGSGVPCPEG